MRVWLALVGFVLAGCAGATDRSVEPDEPAERPSTELLAFDAHDAEGIYDERCRSRHSTVVGNRLVCLCATDWDCTGEELCAAAENESFDNSGVCTPKELATCR